MKKLAVLSVLATSLLIVGCSGGDDGNAGAPVTKGPTGAGSQAGAQKGGKNTAQGLSPSDLKLPPNGGQAEFGSKTGGGGK